MRLKAVNITPTGDVITITGENDAGKTSVLNSIAFALGGKDLIAEVPIRTGASKAKVTVDLKDFKVTRSFSALGGSTLTSEDASGNIVRSPQTLLDKLCSRIAFDPLSFVREKPDKQLETLRKLVGLDFTALDVKRKTAYDERTIANRELASAKARAAECEVDPETPDEEVSVAELMKQLEAVQLHNKFIIDGRKKTKEANESVEMLEEEIGAMERNHQELLQKLKESDESLSGAKIALGERRKKANAYMEQDAKVFESDESPIRAKINEAGTINAKVRDKKNYTKLQKEVATAQKKTDTLSEEIDAFDKEKSDQLSNAKFPLEGLSFDDTGVLLNGVPFTQGSQARQLQAAVAIGIAMNPTVRVILVRDASLLDDRSMELIAKMAAEHDMQFWLERVSDESPGAIVIEDGAVKEVASES
jgi:DNA repair exonuclease SbcCD ATPase subunit